MLEMDAEPIVDTGGRRGLSDADVRARLQSEGYHELPRPDRRTPFRIGVEVLREPTPEA